MGRVNGKVAIITGAASGVGKEDALLLAREGARVVLTDVNEDAGREVAKTIGDAALFVKHDIASEEDWRRVIALTQDTFGGLDVLVNNAAILKQASIEDTTLELWEQVQRVNSTGYFLGCHYGYKAMKARGGGSIINMSSMAGIGGVSSFCAYSASKAAVAGLTRSIAAYSRFHRIPIRCNSIHPDGIKTPMVFNLPRDPHKPSTVREGNDPKRLMDRFCEPIDIAHLVLFLASDESRFINGAELRIDNGYLMWAD
ncbi:3(or 17)beta-hydroxysteroid dehydrogenase [Fontimonas thermophila]|uniref:3(Or 17)beta-hydroxysteroid dehydrogenase n=1 Tax=Fontimonas thermophila TaxID=1076937 RepID=A0A1I2KGM3_9GAMM|nr:SDR family oxidoreductase [Fontimonas thermophila]SFF64407.1 3(or 17)beta-hydroxysteroid dehydrogenase [Fontimonas thermophila]